MGSTVFVLGAGASYGDVLPFHPGYQGELSYVPPNPPLTNQFFNPNYLADKGSDVEAQYSPLFRYVRNHWRIDEPLGSPRWGQLSIEDVFSSLALANNFAAPGTDEMASSQFLLNQLTRYIRRTISMSTMFRFGTYTRTLISRLKPEDSVINFNYDLLADREFLCWPEALQYQNFSVKFLRKDLVKVDDNYEPVRQSLCEPVAPGSNSGPSGPLDGLYLKLHGSLNWFICPNNACPASKTFVIVTSVPQCLFVSAVEHDFQCNYCQSELIPLLVPPLAQKPIMTNPHLRNIWGNAVGVLANASSIVVIGFSFQPSDFYAAWLFRYARENRESARVFIVNPDGDKDWFQSRMRNIFGDRCDFSFKKFEQIDAVIQALQT